MLAMSHDTIGIAVIVALAVGAAIVLWRSPGLWRAMRKHYAPGSIAERLDQRAAMHRRPRTEEEALEQIRLHLAAMGHPVHHLSDAELKVAIRHFNSTFRKGGIPARDAAESIQLAAKAMRTHALSADEFAQRLAIPRNQRQEP